MFSSKLPCVGLSRYQSKQVGIMINLLLFSVICNMEWIICLPLVALVFSVDTNACGESLQQVRVKWDLDHNRLSGSITLCNSVDVCEVVFIPSSLTEQYSYFCSAWNDMNIFVADHTL